MKGIILAGGTGSRLYPVTKSTCKQLLPIYDKPMIYYPLSVLMLAGIKEILIITTPEDLNKFKSLLGTGEQLGVSFNYIAQCRPEGVAQAFQLGEDFIGDDDVCLILGDNIFYGDGFIEFLKQSIKIVKTSQEAVIFGYKVVNPKQYGVVEFSDYDNTVLSIEEKPQNPKSKYAVVGLYFYPNDVIFESKKVKVSERGEFEISSINQAFLKLGRLKVELMGRGFAWLDTGTHEDLLEAGNFVQTIERRQGHKIACIEEIAFRNGWIDERQLLQLAGSLLNSGYGKYLTELIL